MSDEWKYHDATEEEEVEQSKKAYAAATKHIPEDDLPEELGEIEAAIVIGFDGNDLFHVVGMASDKHRKMVRNASRLIRQMLLNVHKYFDFEEEQQ